MASLLSSSQRSLASQLLQKNIAICHSPCGSGLARDGSAAVFKAGLAGKPAPTEKHRNLPLSLWERACPRWQRRCLQGRARWQASSYRKASQSPTPPVGVGLPAMASLLSSRQSSLASQLLQKSIAISRLPLWERACPRWRLRWLQGRARRQASSYRKASARDGVAAGFKPELAGKPAPTEKHRNLPLPLWERACPRWQRRCLQGRARWQASSYRKTPQSPAYPLWERACPRWQRRCLQGRARWQASAYKKTPQSPTPPVGAGLPATLATNP